MSSPDMNVNSTIGRQPYLPPEEGTFTPPVGPVETAKTKEAPYAQYVASYIPQTFTKGSSGDAKAEEPRLPSPIEGQKKHGAEPAVQDIVRGFVAKEITMLLPQLNSPTAADSIFANLMTGAKLEDPKLLEIANQIRGQIEAKVKKEARLDNFTMEALYIPNEAAWTQTPLAPYGREKKAEIYDFHDQTLQKNLNDYLTKATPQDPALLEDFAMMKERLTIAVGGGNVHPSIKAALTQIRELSIQETQQKYGLPIGWKPGITEVENWKPVNIGLVSVNAVGNARTERLVKNVDTLLTNLSEMGKVLLNELPENDPRRKEVEGYISTIIEATSKFKKQLEEFQMILAQQSEQYIGFIKDNQIARDKANINEVSEAKETINKQLRMEKFGLAMKIIGPIIAALSIVIGIAISAATVGLASPIALAGVAVGLAMLTYSVVDSTTGATSKMMEGFNDLIDKMAGGASDFGKALIKLTMVITAVALVALLVAAIASGSGAGAAANMATQTIANTAKQATVMAMKQIAIQASVILIMGSGVLLEVPAEALKLTGWDNTTIDILKYAIMAMEMIAVMVVAMKMTSSSMKLPGADAAQAASQASQTVTQKLTSAAKTVKDEIANSVEATIEQLKKSLDTLINRVKNINTILPDIKTSFIESLQATKHIFTSRTKSQIALFLADRFAKTGPLILNTASSAYMASVHFQLSRILKESADTEEMLAEIQAMIDMLESVIKQLQSSMDVQAEDMMAFGETVENLFKSLTSSAKKLVEAAPVQG